MLNLLGIITAKRKRLLIVKRFLKIILTTLLLLGLVLCSVGCGEDSDNSNKAKGLKYKKDAKTGLYTIYGYVQEDEVTVLDLGAVKDKDGNAITVGKIATGAFSGNDALTKIIVPDTVTEISAGAFKNMNKLEELVLPFIGKTATADVYYGQTHDAENDGVEKSVDLERTFAYLFGSEEYSSGAKVTANYGAGTSDCYIPAYFKKVTIKTSKQYSIPMYAFSGISLLREVELCDTVVAIGDNAFSNCHDLTKVNFPSSITAIYKEAFKDSANFGKNLDETSKTALKTLIDSLKKGSDVYTGTYLDK